MSFPQHHHEHLKHLLAQQDWDAAQTLWLDLAEQFPDQPEFLLLLLHEFCLAHQTHIAADLASLLAPTLRETGKLHEWLYALKLQAHANPTDNRLRAELLQAYQTIYQTDPRLRTILTTAGLDQPRTPLPAAIAKTDTLLALQPGAYCQHKSWGIGQVKTFDTALQRLIVNFPHNPDHPMQLAYAAESLTPISPDHIEVRKRTDLPGLKTLATEQPLALLRLVLLSHNRAATAQQIETTLAGSVIAPEQWKKWWENTRKLLKRDPHFELPAKKTDPIRLRTAPVSRQQELLEAFRTAPSLAQKTDVARALLKELHELGNSELLIQEFQDGLLPAIEAAGPAKLPDRIEALVVLEQLRTHQRTPAEDSTPLLRKLLATTTDLPKLLDNLSAPAQKRVIGALKSTEPARLLAALNELPAKALEEMAELLSGAADRIAQWVRTQSASPELLFWLCRNLDAPLSESLPRTAVLRAVLHALETHPAKSTKKLHELLVEDPDLLTDLLLDADEQTVRDIARQILASPAFQELDRRSLMARLIKEFPFVQEMVTSSPERRRPLIVSRASYERRRAEVQEITEKKLPQLSREIAQARSYGDLSENFEYKAAKHQQRLLLRRRSELERLLARAQPVDFTAVNTDTVQIGTSVTVTDLDTGQSHTYHILGAWDSDPERNIISYPAALAQALLGKRPGDIASFSGEHRPHRLRIERIEKVPAEILQTL